MPKELPGITNKATFSAWLAGQQSTAQRAEAFSIRLPIAKYDAEKGIVTGWAALSSADDKPLIDFHDDLLLVSELEKACHGLVLDGGAGKAGEMHAGRVGDIVEAMVMSKEKAAALGLGDIKTEGWIVSLKLHDAGAIGRVKSGDRGELSIHGLGKRIPVGDRDGKVVNALVDLSVDEISIVDHGASGNADALPRIVLAKRRESSELQAGKGLGARFIEQIRKIFGKESTMDLDAILAKLSEQERAIVLAAIEAAAKKAPAAAAPAAPAEPEMAEAQKAAIVKALPEEVRKLIEAGEKARVDEIAKAKEAAAKSEAALAEVRKQVAEMQDREEIAKFVDKAKALPFLAGKSTEEIAKLLRAASKGLKAEEYTAIEKLLETANEAIKASPLFVDAGNRGNGAETTAKGQIEAIAKKLREADKDLTPELAISKALEENPELYKTYKAELAQQAK